MALLPFSVPPSPFRRSSSTLIVPGLSSYTTLRGNTSGLTIVGGTSTTADLSLQTTSGVGATGADMHFLVGNNGATEAMTILNSGFIGIATNDPGFRLDISGATLNLGSDGVAVTTRTDVTTKLSRISMPHYTNSEEQFSLFAGASTSSTNVAAFGGGATGYNAATQVSFYTAANNTTTVGTERMTINSSGNVGIGITGPGAKLDVRDGNSILTDTDVAHGITTLATTETFGHLSPLSGTAGGLLVRGFSDDDATGLQLTGILGSDTPTATTPALILSSQKKNGTGIQALADTETLLSLNNSTTTRIRVLGTGKTLIGNVDSGGIMLSVFSASAGTALVAFQANGLTNGQRVLIITTTAVTGTVYAVNAQVNSSTRGIFDIQQNGNGSAEFQALVAGTGDPLISFAISAGQVWAAGMDNSDSDKFKIASANSLGSASDRITIETGGNVGIGTVAPKSLLQVGTVAGFNGSLGGAQFSNNLYYDSGWKYLTTNEGNVLDLDTNGNVGIYTAPSGTADTAATLTNRFTILNTGNVGIGTTSPTAVLHLKAGTATASTAPLKFTSGTNLTSAEAGAVEFTTDDLFFTITTGAARKAFILDDGTRLTSGRVPFATTNGRLVDDSDFTFATDTLTVTKIAATTFTGNITLSTKDIVTDTTTGTKIATAASQKLGLWNATPIVQPTTAVAAATFVANTSAIANDTATFDGYTIGQVVKALRNIGALA